jgi:DegV family protein with EDD domain
VNTNVRIVTDSTCCLPQEFVDQYEISVLPVGLIIEDKVYRDCIDISLDEICRRIEEGKKQPTTAAVSPGEFVDTFSMLAESSENIVCILVSKVLTATQESAYQAKRQIRAKYPDLNIEIIDSKTSAGALGFIVAEAARVAQQGKTMAEVIEIVRDMISRVMYLATLDTLKYLINIGRAPRSGTIGEMLNIKPIIGFVDDTGTIDVIARVRGKNQSLLKMIGLIGEYIETKPSIHVMVHYSVSREEGEELKDKINARYKCSELYITPYSPVMVSATGPMTGISFYS